MGVRLSVASWSAGLPTASQMYLPEEGWVKDSKRRHQAGVPEQIGFQTKPQIAVQQIRRAVEANVHRGAVLADAA